MEWARAVNSAYERGWREGWTICLSRIEELGLEEVQRRERMQGIPEPMPLMNVTELQQPKGGEHMEEQEQQQPAAPDEQSADTGESAGTGESQPPAEPGNDEDAAQDTGSGDTSGE